MREAEQAERKLGGALHVAQLHRFGERQARVAIGLLRHLHAVERRVVEAELVIEGRLFHEDLAT